jgi:hypothetical protein
MNWTEPFSRFAYSTSLLTVTQRRPKKQRGLVLLVLLLFCGTARIGFALPLPLGDATRHRWDRRQGLEHLLPGALVFVPAGVPQVADDVQLVLGRCQVLPLQLCQLVDPVRLSNRKWLGPSTNGVLM